MERILLNSSHPLKNTTPTTDAPIVIQIQVATLGGDSKGCERGGSTSCSSTHSGHSVPTWGFHVPSVASQVMLSLPLSCRGLGQPRVMVFTSSRKMIADFGRVNSPQGRSSKLVVWTSGVVESGGVVVVVGVGVVLVHSGKVPHFPDHWLHATLVGFCGRIGDASHIKKTERLPESEYFSSK